MIKIECTLCGRSGQYRPERFYEIAGTTNKPDARIAFAKAMGCERALTQAADQVHDRCGIQYVVE